VTEDKNVNHKTASSYLKRAAEGGAQLAVLPEIWNSPYATAAFGEYAEVLPHVGDNMSEKSPSAQLLMNHAKTNGMFIVGGSIPENDGGKIYNTCLVIDPQGKVVAKHRKVHLFDIDVPGGITFRESDTLSAGETMTAFDGGEVFGMVGVGIWYVER
jgi:omega-amidase